VWNGEISQVPTASISKKPKIKNDYTVDATSYWTLLNLFIAI